MTFLYLMGLLALIVFIHEGGHYTAARWLGYPVEKFQIGMGPPLLRYKNANGTQFGFSPLLIGGFVKIEKSVQEEITPKHWLLVVAAGPGFNIVAWLCFMMFLPFVLGGTIEQHFWHQMYTAQSLLAGLVDLLLKPISWEYWKEMFQLGNLVRVNDVIPEVAKSNNISELQVMFSMFVGFNFAIAVINLVPIMPLDGGQILRSLLKMSFPSQVKLVERASTGFAVFGAIYFGLWMLGTLLADIWVFSQRLLS